MQKKRVWILSALYYPETTSTGFHLTGIAEGLATANAVSAVCGQPSYLARGIRAPWRETYHGVDIYRCRATIFDKNKLAGRAVNIVTVSVSLFLKVLLQVRRGDVVIVVTTPPALPYLAAIACKLRGCTFVLMVYDVYPEVLTRLNMLRSTDLSVRLMEHASRWLYRSADRVVVLGRDMQRLVANKLRSDQGRITIIPTWGDTDLIYPTPRAANSLLARLQLTNKFVVEYCGNIGRTHGLEDLVDAAERLAHDPDIHFLVIGWGAKKAWLLREKERRGLQNMSVLEPLPEAELCDGLNACDIAMISFSPGMSGVSVPSRMYNVLASGKPLLTVCDEDSELAAVVREEEVGWVVPPHHVNKLVATIREARANAANLQAMGGRARAAAETKYTRAHTMDAYRALVADLWQE